MVDYCKKTGKHTHKVRAKAVAQLKSIRKQFPNYGGKVYPCSYCKGFHVGRLQKPAPRRRSTEHDSKRKLSKHRRDHETDT